MAHITLLRSEARVVVDGRITIDSSPALRSALLSLIHKNKGLMITIDLSGVSYLDTSAIATLLEALSGVGEQSGRLWLTGLREQPRSLVEITELAEIFRMSGSEVEFA